MIGIYAYRLDTAPRLPIFLCSMPAARTDCSHSADFRPLSLAAGCCGYCPLSLCLSALSLSLFCSVPPPVFRPLHMHRSDPLNLPCLLPLCPCFVTRFLFCVCYCFVSLDICFVRCVLACVFGLPPAHFLLPNCPAALYPFRHPLSPSPLKFCIFDSTFGQFLRDEQPL